MGELEHSSCLINLSIDQSKRCPQYYKIVDPGMSCYLSFIQHYLEDRSLSGRH